MIGQTLGKYRIQERIGRGGMGTVYRATDETLHREVAIKALNPELNEPEVARRFRAEAVTIARLNHPGIATIYELLEHDGQCFMVMEFVRGETLEHLVDRAGALPPEQAAELEAQALTALAYAHAMGVIHRDIKPANLMVTESGAVKVMDFGIARVVGTEHVTHAGFMMGTPAYMAPEQVRGEEVDARADLYGMGVVLYRLTTAKLPFKGDTPFLMAQSQLNDIPTPPRLQREGLPDWIERILSRALAKAPAERFQTADEFREALRRGVNGLPLDMATMMAVPPELMETTPPRAMPASLLGTSSRVLSSAPLKMPTSASGTASASPAPPLAVPAVPVAAPVPPPAEPAAQTTSNLMVLAGLAAIVVLVAGMWWWHTRGSAPIEAPAKATASQAPVQPQVQPSALPASTAPAVVPPAPRGAPASAKVGSAPAPVAPPASPATVGLSVARGSDAASRRSGAAPKTPDGPDVHVAYSNIKLLTVKGSDSTDRDVIFNFGGGQMSVLPSKGGTALFSSGYKGIVQATYVHARDPKWDPSLASPVTAKFNLPGMFHPARHWLVLQNQVEFVILRLDDTNWKTVLETVESCTGQAVSRPTAGS